jgi:iron complex outermembrane receptor protein
VRTTLIAIVCGSLAYVSMGTAHAQQSPTPNSPQSTTAQGSGQGALEEVLVTAQKKTERLEDVPVPVSVIDTQALTDNDLLMLRDLNGSVPSLAVTPGTQNGQSLTIRGISTGVYGIPTVGITVDDVLLSGGAVIPDFDPGDIARIEVLRGPQGTLYGADSIGGLLKYVTSDPSTKGFSGSIQSGTSTVYNGAELGYNFRGSVNVPISDTIAVSASAFKREDPGYIDDVLTGQNGVNKADTYGGRFAALWLPSDMFSLKLSALYQHMEGEEPVAYAPTPGYPITTGIGDLQQKEFSGGGDYSRVFQLYSATMKAHFEGVDLISITGYNMTTARYSSDLTYLVGPSLQAELNLNSEPGAQIAGPSADKIFSEEIRASSHFGTRFDWVLGAFFSRDLSPAGENSAIENAVTPVTGQYIANSYIYVFSATSLVDKAAFVDLTYHFTDSFDVQVGARESFDTSWSGDATYIVPGSSPTFYPGLSTTTVNAATYSFTPRYKVSNDLMVYSRIASGYQPGGPNGGYGSPGVPQTYGAAKTWTYEVGLKSSQLDDRLSIDTSVYYIDWTGIQVNLQTAEATSFTGNAGCCKERGR